MNEPLHARTCEPCRGGIPPMERDEATRRLAETPGWELADGPPMHLMRRFAFRNFAEAQAFAVRVGDLAEQEGHHPEITYGWGYGIVRWWTHKIGGLHENDFIMAAKVNEIARRAGLDA